MSNFPQAQCIQLQVYNLYKVSAHLCPLEFVQVQEFRKSRRKLVTLGIKYLLIPTFQGCTYLPTYVYYTSTNVGSGHEYFYTWARLIIDTYLHSWYVTQTIIIKKLTPTQAKTLDNYIINSHPNSKFISRYVYLGAYSSMQIGSWQIF